jgi:hypothetical protein
LGEEDIWTKPNKRRYRLSLLLMRPLGTHARAIRELNTIVAVKSSVAIEEIRAGAGRIFVHAAGRIKRGQESWLTLPGCREKERRRNKILHEAQGLRKQQYYIVKQHSDICSLLPQYQL